MRLRDNIALGERWSFLSAGAVNAGQLAVLILLVHLLPSSAFATFAIANAFTGLTQLLLQSGLSYSLFFRKGDQLQMSTIFWSNVLLALLACGFLGVMAPYIGNYYRAPLLVETIWWLLPGVALGAASAFYKTLHLKALHFAFLARAEIVVMLAGGLSALVLAWFGWGVFALAAQVLVRAGCESLLLVAGGWRMFRPSRKLKLSSIRPHLKFSIAHVGERFSMWAISQIDVLLIGKLLGFELLGVYEVFRRILSRPPAVLGEIMERLSLPLMARYAQRPRILKRLYLTNMEMMAALVFPVYGFLALLANLLVPVFFGPGWKTHAAVFSFMALTSAFQSIGHPLDNLLVARGTIRRLLYWNLLFLCLYIGLIYLGSYRGLEGVVLLFFLASVLLNNPACFFLLNREVKVGVKEYFLPIFRAATLVLLSSLFPFLLMFRYSGAWSWLWGTLFFGLFYWFLARKFQPDIWRRVARIAHKREVN